METFWKMVAVTPMVVLTGATVGGWALIGVMELGLIG